MDELLGNLVTALRDTYAIERELGGGGMSRVFLAEEKALGRKVVIKVLPPDLGAGFNVDRFRREIKVAASLQHPHIVPLLAAGQAGGGTDGQPLLFFTMPFVEGESLRAKIEREGELPVSTTVKVLRDVLDALDYAHAHNVIHRDIKPDNVLVSGQHAVVTDFGVAKALSESAGSSSMTSAGLALGTPAYMAPEQAAADPHVDHRADIYAVGAMGYEMLTGSPVFTGTTAQQVLAAQVTRTPEPLALRRPSIPPMLAAIVMRCLEKSPADRWQSAAEVRHELERAATPSGGTAPTVPVGAVRSRRPVMVGVAALTLAVLAVAGFIWWRGRPAAVALDPNVVTVLPFRVTGADATYGEGMVDLLAAKLTGEGGPRATDPQSSVSAWRSAGGQSDLPRNEAIGVARRLGAGKLIIGSVIGTPSQLALTATIVDVPSGREDSRGEVSGAPDSLMTLVDRLAAQLLAGSTGEGGHRLEKLTSTSLPALRAYLAGQASFRRGAYVDAVGHFRRAVEHDSSFALAAIALASANNWVGTNPLRDSALDLAERLRNRLSARDAAYLDMIEANANYPKEVPAEAWTAAAQRLIDLAPESAAGWYDLGDSYFHEGGRYDLSQEAANRQAETAFRRALALDSAFAAPLEHLIEIAVIRDDTATIRRLSPRYFQIDSAGDIADFMRWRVAGALGDTAALTALRARMPEMNENSLIRILGTAILDGIYLEDVVAAGKALERNLNRDQQVNAAFGWIDVLGNLGRFREAVPHYEVVKRLGGAGGFTVPIWDAIFADGDTVLAFARFQEALPEVQRAVETDPSRRARQYELTCAVSVWLAAHGDTARALSMLARLDRMTLPSTYARLVAGLRGCSAATRALIAPPQERALRIRIAQQLDTTQAFEDNNGAKLMSARLRLQAGDTTGALASLRHRSYHWNSTAQLAAVLREEGRLAALTGDRQGAIRAYQHYLRLRANAEPRLQPQVTQVREELARLVGEQ